MNYTRGYEVTYTWRCYGENDYYTESLDFETEEELNKFCLEALHEFSVEVVELKKVCYEKWEK